MKKTQLYFLIALSCSTIGFSQVGINTNTPAVTFDINAKNPTGTTTNVDGLLVPRVDRQRAQSMTTIATSTLIYVSTVATGTQTGTAVNIDAVGYYYYNGSIWVKLHNPNNTGIQNIYTTDGTLTGNRTVTQGANTLGFTGSVVNAFSVDGSTFSVDAANRRIGVGTTAPTNTLHITSTADPLRLQGTTAGNPNTDRPVVIDANGVVKTINTLNVLGIPSPAVFRLATAQSNFLNGIGAGGTQVVPMAVIKNAIDGLTYNATTSTITFPPGTYQMTFVYEATHDNTGCSISSYLVDFPLNSGTQRIHSTASHNQGGLSNHGGTITYTTLIPSTRTWQIALGRGQSGNCSGTGMTLAAISSQLLVFRVGD
ncbi:hypothetical protein ASG22_01035 [Chryseobacterium sp. Leaf405]|uniref:hypothetical protein n=1 Tax=Chryseobacterium sp. Leaf405 TaxID=1736367 RepID=UPI0006FD3E95|nr:hypothetical protein [Chryseobacterium sp. Leaf405]KQT35639.1 hypothetical protein ASG22_01035 [Chryseobacterium sp. Leaf405]